MENKLKGLLIVHRVIILSFNLQEDAYHDKYHWKIGDIHLIGKYVNIGIDYSGSFGSNVPVSSSYYNGPLGFIADFDKNGFKPSPDGYSGDYFVPGYPIEGIFFQN